MEYRGKKYTVVQGLERGVWRWTIELDENTTKSGEAKTQAAALTAVVMLIDKARRLSGNDEPAHPVGGNLM